MTEQNGQASGGSYRRDGTTTGCVVCLMSDGVALVRPDPGGERVTTTDSRLVDVSSVGPRLWDRVVVHEREAVALAQA